MGEAKKQFNKAKGGVSKSFKSVGKTLTGNSVVGQVNNTVMGAVTGGMFTANKKGLVQGGNAAEALTGGMASSGDLTVDKAKKLVADNVMPGGPEAPKAPKVNNVKADPDPYLEEELANARKRGRTSTIVAGLTDTGGGTSSRKSLLGV